MELVEEPLFLPREYLSDFYPSQQPLIVDDIPDYLMDALTQLGWGVNIPVYHKFDSNGDLVVSLSPSLYIGRFGPLQRTIPNEHFGPGRDRGLVDLLHRLQTLGDSTKPAR